MSLDAGKPEVQPITGLASDAKRRLVWSPVLKTRQVGKLDGLGLAVYEVGERQILCAEPSPDAMSTFSEALAAGLSVDVPSQVGVSGEFSRSFAELGAILGIRTATIQVLRDGFYRACEAYGNGVLDTFGYAMILGRIDGLMIDLMAIEALGRGKVEPADAAKVQAAATAEAGLRNAEQALRAAEGRVLSAESRAREARTRRDRLRDSRIALEAKKADLQTRVGDATTPDAEKPKLRGELAATEAEILQSDAALKDQQSELDAANKEEAEAKTQVKTLLAARNSAQTQAATAAAAARVPPGEITPETMSEIAKIAQGDRESLRGGLKVTSAACLAWFSQHPTLTEDQLPKTLFGQYCAKIVGKMLESAAGT